jgi:two-component SAPR family response regulator
MQRKTVPSRKNATRKPNPNQATTATEKIIALLLRSDALQKQNPAKSETLVLKALKDSQQHAFSIGTCAAKLRLVRTATRKSDFATAEKMLVELKNLYTGVSEDEKANPQNQTVIAPGDIEFAESTLALYRSDYAEAEEKLHAAFSYYETLSDGTVKNLNMSKVHNALAVVYAKHGKITNAFDELAKSLDLKRRSDDESGEIEVLVNLGAVYSESSQFQKAVETFEQVLERIKQTGADSNDRQRLNVYGNLGFAHQALGNYAEAMRYNFLCGALVARTKNIRQAYHNKNSLASCYVGMGDYISALGCYKEAIALAQHLDNKEGLAISYIGVAIIYLQMSDTVTALDYLLRGLRFGEEVGFKRVQVSALEQLGDVYRSMQNLPQALVYHSQAYALAQQIQDHQQEVAALESLGQVYEELGDSEIALGFYKQGIKLAGDIGAKPIAVELHLSLAELYTSKNNEEQSAESLYHALRLAEEIQSKPRLSKVHQALSKHFAWLGNERESTRHEESYLALQKELMNSEKEKRVRQLMAEIELDKLQKATRQVSLNPKTYSLLENAVKNPPRRQTADTESTKAPKLKASGVGVSGVVIKTFGQFRVTLNGKTIQPEDWQRKKARDLFKFLLLHHQQTVTTDQILDALWTETDPKNAEVLLMTAISHVRKALSLYAPRKNWIITGSRSYTLNLGDHAEIDFIRFKQIIHEARTADEATQVRLYEKAVALYDGEFLREDAFEEWTSFEREELKDIYLSAMQSLAERAFAAAQYDEAITLCRKMLTADVLHEKSYHIAITALLKKNQPLDAQKMYDQCKRSFKKELAASPPKSLEQLLNTMPRL